MRVLHISSGDFFSSYGGGQVYVKNIVDEMIRQGFDVVILSLVNKNIVVSEHNYNGVLLCEVGTIASSEDIIQLIRSIQPTIIHTHGSEFQFCVLGERLSIPVVVTAHHGGIFCPAGTLMNADDQICQTTLSHKHCLKCCLANIRTGRGWYPMMRLLPEKGYVKLGKNLQKLPFIPFVTPIGGVALSIQNKIAEWGTICDKTTRIIAPSNAIAEAMCRNGLSRDKVIVIPHGIPKATLPLNCHPKHSEGDLWKSERFFLPNGCQNDKNEVGDSGTLNEKRKIRFFYVGRICRVKGLHILLDAFNGILTPDKVELHIIGGAGNKGEQRYMDALQHRYTSPNIVWHGKVAPEKVFDTIKDFDVMVHPTICLEIFGLNIAEALTMNKPVLATRCGGAEMQIREGVNGWLVAPNDVVALRNKMNEILESGITMDVSTLHINVISIDEHVKELIQVYEKETIIDRCKLYIGICQKWLCIWSW